eukprot:scaffold51333_cov27-Tisochrysis_lutea.AAC.5
MLCVSSWSIAQHMPHALSRQHSHRSIACRETSPLDSQVQRTEQRSAWRASGHKQAARLNGSNALHGEFVSGASADSVARGGGGGRPDSPAAQGGEQAGGDDRHAHCVAGQVGELHFGLAAQEQLISRDAREEQLLVPGDLATAPRVEHHAARRKATGDSRPVYGIRHVHVLRQVYQNVVVEQVDARFGVLDRHHIQVVEGVLRPIRNDVLHPDVREQRGRSLGPPAGERPRAYGHVGAQLLRVPHRLTRTVALREQVHAISVTCANLASEWGGGCGEGGGCHTDAP